MGDRGGVIGFVMPALLLAIAFAALTGCRPSRTQSEVEVLPAGRDLLAGRAGGWESAGAEMFETLAWQDVQPTAEGSAGDPGRRKHILQITAQSRRAPALYLRGLLFLAGSDPNAALDAFARLTPDEIPALHLYAPYRLYGNVHPKVPNPYLPAVRRAISDNRLPPLIEARVEAHEGDLSRSLSAYLRSDPGLWTGHDFAVFQGMLQHAGLANETGIMLRAALRGGRVAPMLRTNLVSLLTPSTAASREVLNDRLRQYLESNPQGRAIATAATQRQLALRQRFVQKDYRGLLDDHRLADPVTVPNETAILLLLAAAKERDQPALDRWSQEVKRRVPTPEVEQWVNQITAEAK